MDDFLKYTFVLFFFKKIKYFLKFFIFYQTIKNQIVQKLWILRSNNRKKFLSAKIQEILYNLWNLLKILLIIYTKPKLCDRMIESHFSNNHPFFFL